MVDFLTAFDTRLKTLASRVFYGDEINPNTKIPYVNWSYTTTIDVESMEDFIIEVTITDSGTDATRIEGIVAAIDGDGDLTNPTGMNYYHYSGEPNFRVFRINRLSLPATEKMLRRQLRYRARAYL